MSRIRRAVTGRAGRHDRAAGALLACAAGDALGAGYEFAYPAPNDVITMKGGGPFGFAPGEWTDDTSMAIAVARVIVTGRTSTTTPGSYAVAARFAESLTPRPRTWATGPAPYSLRGNRTGAAMQAAASDLPGRKGGNGSLMRTAADRRGPSRRRAGACRAGGRRDQQTHPRRRTAPHRPAGSGRTQSGTPCCSGTFDGVHDFLDERRGDVAAYWAPLIAAAETGNPSDFPKNGWVVHALQTAWWAITHADGRDPTHLQAALKLAVRAGHDTDTTAAIAGTLLGARWGASAVPARWRRILHGWPGLRSRDLVALGVLDRAGRPSGRDRLADVRASRLRGVAHQPAAHHSPARPGRLPRWLCGRPRRRLRRGRQPVPDGRRDPSWRARRVLSSRMAAPALTPTWTSSSTMQREPSSTSVGG